MRVRPGLLVLLALAAVLATLGIVAVRGQGAPVSRAQQVQQIAAGLHCPICKDLSVADSPAPLAQQMRAQIEQELAAGRSPADIRAGFVAAYGDSVLMTPPRHGLAGTAYALPLGIVAGGVLVVIVLMRRWRTGAADEEPAERLPAAQRLAVRRAVERLREEEPG
ncbi:MAG TPA: cytochrome c-type biogenesis protein CcmH [Mycobacteriales bacterium]|nr:cytochrome c-type biogenesis protein CcmH [Mycobacteriales bacterium]